MSKDGRPRFTPDLANVIMCGGEPTANDLAAIQAFRGALSQPTEHLTTLALIETDAELGDQEAIDALKRHAEHCRFPECNVPEP